MRFLDMPKQAMLKSQEQSIVKLTLDPGLHSLSDRLDVKLYPEEEIKQRKQTQEGEEWEAVLASFSLQPNQVVAIADSPGKAILLMVRDTFKSPLYTVLYTIFLLAATFHAFNGFWTFLITWGVILSYRSQKAMIPVCMFGVVALTCLGLAAIWGSYWMAQQ
jgi:succinate dehydrogenase / fumarate reductase cytochrome b subunit